MKFRGGIALIFLLIGTPLLGQTPRVVSDVDTTLVSVGDRITYQVSVDHVQGSTVVWPDSLNLEPFEVLEGRVNPPIAQGQNVRSSLALTLTAFELGDLEIPSFPIEVVTSEGESMVLYTNPFGIRVSTVGLDEGDDIRQLKGPLSIPVSLGRGLIVALVAILALTAAYLLFRRMRRKDPKSAALITPLPSRPPHEVALEAFHRLETSPLLAQGRVKDFHIQASEILRVYVEGRFRVPALEMTTFDITGGLEKTGVKPPVVEEFRGFLHRCDMVKFAKSRPSDEDSRSLVEFGKKLVEDTLPASEHPESAPVQPESAPVQPESAPVQPGPPDEGNSEEEYEGRPEEHPDGNPVENLPDGDPVKNFEEEAV